MHDLLVLDILLFVAVSYTGVCICSQKFQLYNLLFLVSETGVRSVPFSSALRTFAIARLSILCCGQSSF